ncbi:hypothetical protein LguiB_031605 [Lonicera macranthoides]
MEKRNSRLEFVYKDSSSSQIGDWSSSTSTMSTASDDFDNFFTHLSRKCARDEEENKNQITIILASVDEEILRRSTLDHNANNFLDKITSVQGTEQWTAFRETLALQMFADTQGLDNLYTNDNTPSLASYQIKNEAASHIHLEIDCRLDNEHCLYFQPDPE